jgi:hypothetical protein
MAQTNFTPIQLYRTSTAAAVPTAGNLAAGELAINLTDERLYFKNAAGVVKLLASNTGALGTVTSVDGSGGTTGLTLTGGPITSSGTLTLGGTLGVANGGTGTATAFTAGSVVFAGASGVYSQDNANLFWDNSNDRLGIGTATPLVRLHVAGGTGILVSGNGASGFNYAQFSNDVSNGVAIGVGGSTASGWTQNLAAVFNASNNPLAFGTNNLERMRITAAGDVGIGTSTPTEKLQVQVNTGTSGFENGITLTNGVDANLFNYVTGTAATDKRGFITVGAANQSLAFGTLYTERMRIDSSGNVMVGAAAANNKFLVSYSNPVSVPAAGAGGHCTAFGTVGYGLATGAITNGNAYLQATRWDGTATNYDLLLQPNGGNVGIGTTSPAYPLEVRRDGASSSTYIGALNTTATGSSGAAGYLACAGSNFAYFYVRGDGLAYIDNATANPLIFGINGTERVRITSAGNVGIGTSTPALNLVVSDAGAAGLEFSPTGGIGGGTYIQAFNRSTSAYTPITNYASQHTWYAGSARAMDIDGSGNVGIGTTSPAANLDVFSTPGGEIRFGNASGTGRLIANGSATYMGSYSNHPVVFQTNQDEKMRISAAGDVGIGTTTPSVKLDISGADAATSSLRVTNSTYGVTVRLASSIGITDRATLYTEGAHALAFGTNNTERMRIDTSGNVGIGTAAIAYTTSGRTTVYIDGTSSSLLGLGVGGTEAGYIGAFSSTAVEIAAAGASRALVLTTNGAERARITTAGDLLVGTTSSTFAFGGRGVVAVNGSSEALYGLNVGGAGVGYLFHTGTNMVLSNEQTGGALIFSASAAERARIDSSGNLLVGCTSTAFAGGASTGLYLTNSTGNNGGLHIKNLSNNTSANAVTFYGWDGSQTGSIQTYVNVTAYNTSSDYRLKNVDGPITNSGAYVDALKPVQGSWKSDGSRFIGLLAHEVQEVSETPIATGEKDGEQMQAMDYSAPELIANLIAEIQSLRARVAQLEERK